MKTWLTGLVQKDRELEKEVKDLKNNQVSKLEKMIEKHIADDKSQEIFTEIKHLSSNGTKASDKLDRISSDIAGLTTQTAANQLFLNNLNTSFQRHKELNHDK